MAAAAARAGLKFVIFTDHGDGTNPPVAPEYIGGVLCLIQGCGPSGKPGLGCPQRLLGRLGAGLGGFVYETAGPMTLYAGASALALAGGVVAWFALRGPELDRPLSDADDVPADPSIAPPEPLG